MLNSIVCVKQFLNFYDIFMLFCLHYYFYIDFCDNPTIFLNNTTQIESRVAIVMYIFYTINSHSDAWFIIVAANQKALLD